MATCFLLHQGHSSFSSKANLAWSNFSVVTFPHIPLVTPVSDQVSSSRAELYMAVQHAANFFTSKINTRILCLLSTNPAGSKVCPYASTTGCSSVLQGLLHDSVERLSLSPIQLQCFLPRKCTHASWSSPDLFFTRIKLRVHRCPFLPQIL